MQVKINFIQHKIYFYDYQAGSTKKRTEINQSQCVFSFGLYLTGCRRSPCGTCPSVLTASLMSAPVLP